MYREVDIIHRVLELNFHKATDVVSLISQSHGLAPRGMTSLKNEYNGYFYLCGFSPASLNFNSMEHLPYTHWIQYIYNYDKTITVL